MFRTVPLSVTRSFSLNTQWYMSYRFADSLRVGSGWNILILCVQWKTPDGGQRNMQRFIQNKCEKLAYLVGFIIRICHDAGHMNVKK